MSPAGISVVDFDVCDRCVPPLPFFYAAPQDTGYMRYIHHLYPGDDLHFDVCLSTCLLLFRSYQEEKASGGHELVRVKLVEICSVCTF